MIQNRSEMEEERRKGKRVKARDAKMRCCSYQRIQKDQRGGMVFKYQHRQKWAEGLFSRVTHADMLPAPVSRIDYSVQYSRENGSSLA